jgi:transcriptional regulator with XRE-family HTH domain
MSVKISGAQIRAARAYLDVTAAKFADLAGIGASTLQTLESVDDIPEPWLAARAESIGKIVAAFRKAGVTFLDDDGRNGPGLRVKRRT